MTNTKLSKHEIRQIFFSHIDSKVDLRSRNSVIDSIQGLYNLETLTGFEFIKPEMKVENLEKLSIKDLKALQNSIYYHTVDTYIKAFN